MSTRGIVIFDVDGTLCRTSEVDDDCWIASARSILGIQSMSTDWSEYSHSTDEAIATDLVRLHTALTGHGEVLGAVHRIRDDFLRRIDGALSTKPDLFRPVPGATRIFETLISNGWMPAIATGGWRRTAEMKMRAAEVPFEGVAAAHADDAHPREQIVDIAARRAIGDGDGNFERAVYFGDGVWDVRAADRLGIGFVGIGVEANADRLRRAGAEWILPDYRDGDAILDAIEATAAGSMPVGFP